MINIVKAIVSIILITVFFFVIGGGIPVLKKRLKENYTMPDTTIIIKNGIEDTVIKKRTLPWWLK